MNFINYPQVQPGQHVWSVMFVYAIERGEKSDKRLTEQDVLFQGEPRCWFCDQYRKDAASVCPGESLTS